jgi:hypothetical protein
MSLKPVSPLYAKPPQTRRFGSMVASEPHAPLPFVTTDQWAAALDGRVAIVTAKPYQVTYVLVDRSRRTGPPIEYQPLLISEADKTKYLEWLKRPIPQVRYDRGNSSYAVRAPALTIEPSEWPSALPAFLRDAVAFDSVGFLWVRRATNIGTLPTYDVFDRRGALVGRVKLPRETTLVGFGVRVVYARRLDPDGLSHLTRHPLPRW